MNKTGVSLVPTNHPLTLKEITYEVEWQVEEMGSPPSYWDPGDPTIVNVTGARVKRPDGTYGRPLKLTPTQAEKFEAWVCEHVNMDEYFGWDED